jgi:hypothetical protein
MRQAKQRQFNRTLPSKADFLANSVPGEPSHEQISEVSRETLPNSPNDSTLIPADWVKGQLLNVRSGGPGYRVTILGEEWDFRHPERCLEFSNSFECQQFVSNWYSRQSHDPRA